MDVPLRSAIPFLDSRTGRRVDALADTELLVSSRSLGWPDVVVEAGRKESWEVDELTVAHHYLAMNTDAVPLTFEVRGERGFRTVTMGPGSVWLCPAGDAFTHRVAERCDFAAVTVDPGYLGSLLGSAGGEPAGGAPLVELRREYGFKTPQLEHLVRALVAEVDRGNPGGLPFIEAIVTAVGLQIVQQVGVQGPRLEPSRGGLAPRVRRRVLELIDARLAHGLSIEELAREAGVSPSHFIRAFKQSVGRPPHQYILARRLERARQLLEQPGANLSDVALRTGFADQAHFTRLFKRHFGVTPGAALRARAGR